MYHTGKSKSKSRRWGEWSDWIWSDEYQRYYRQRQDVNGNIDYEWHGVSASDETDEATPRETTIEELTDGIAGLEAPSASVYEAHTAEYTVHPGSRSRTKSKASSSGRGKGKQRSYAEPENEYGQEESGEPSGHYQGGDGSESYYDPQTGQYYQYGEHQEAAGGSSSSYAEESEYSRTRSRRHSHGGSSQRHDEVPEEEEQDEDAEFEAAVAASRGYGSYQTAGESSSSAYAPYDDYEDEGPPTPKAGSLDNHIAATGGTVELLDTRYRVEHSSRFQPGEIFKVLWSEPQGSGNDGAPSLSDRREFRDRFGGKFFVGFRRFIVIANDMGHCTCVPILTYGGKACKKRGVKPEKHGIIYERGHKARLLGGEPKLGFPPARIDIYVEGEKLSKESRVNYSKLVTVEHNVKVFFIGTITPGDWDIVSDAVNRCWEDKIHHKRKHFK